MEAVGSSMASEALKAPQGAGIESGGAHWFATGPDRRANADNISSAHIDGKLQIQVCAT
jgi:hypothetical protein